MVNISVRSFDKWPAVQRYEVVTKTEQTDRHDDQHLHNSIFNFLRKGIYEHINSANQMPYFCIERTHSQRLHTVLYWRLMSYIKIVANECVLNYLSSLMLAHMSDVSFHVLVECNDTDRAPFKTLVYKVSSERLLLLSVYSVSFIWIKKTFIGQLGPLILMDKFN